MIEVLAQPQTRKGSGGKRKGGASLSSLTAAGSDRKSADRPQTGGAEAQGLICHRRLL